ncbi:MAG TPA: hypothetical protein VGJ05_07905 [Fimbriiglobus sp.]|jgi:hypothetical protein
MRRRDSFILAFLVLLSLAAVGTLVGSAAQPGDPRGAVGHEVGRYQVITDKNIQPVFLVDSTTGKVWEREAGVGGLPSTWRQFITPPK